MMHKAQLMAPISNFVPRKLLWESTNPNENILKGSLNNKKEIIFKIPKDYTRDHLGIDGMYFDIEILSESVIEGDVISIDNLNIFIVK